MRFEAKLTDGRVLTESDFRAVSLLPLELVEEVAIEAEEGAQPVVLAADVKAGERVHYFVRHAVPVGNPEAQKISVPVFEIRKDDHTLCRLYWHPHRGPILASQDLYF